MIENTFEHEGNEIAVEWTMEPKAIVELVPNSLCL